MTDKLKTLKDFGEYDLLAHDLKQEAIRHIKEITKKENNRGNYRSNQMNPRKQGKISWIKHFFNITDEDLKK